jgi:formylglycine-generating enzyme required for sulfatase activity
MRTLWRGNGGSLLTGTFRPAFRAGSWDDIASLCRIAFRDGYYAIEHLSSVGMRPIRRLK